MPKELPLTCATQLYEMFTELRSLCLTLCVSLYVVYVHKYQPSYMQRDSSINEQTKRSYTCLTINTADDCVGAKEIDNFVTDLARPYTLTKKVK